MQVYFDKENLISFLKERKDSRFKYCEETLLQHCHIFMNFPKEELLEDSDENEMIKDWMKSCADGFDTVSWHWGCVFPLRPIKSNVAKTFTPLQHSAVYLINDEKLSLLKDKHQYLVSNFGEELEVLAQLWFDDRQYTKNVFPELDSWAKLMDYQSPCSDIIICDQYIIKNESLLDFNLYKLLLQLCYSSTQSKMNIVIFTLKESNGCQCVDCSILKNKIQQILEEKTGLKPNVAIITGSSKKLGEHDRTIFTNYKLYNSGDSFNYFNSKGEIITDGRFFYVHSLVSKDNKMTACLFLKDMQKLYDNIKNTAPDNIYKESACKCNYLVL